ncbi:MAG: SPOR domain-containing protein [Candidatus Omnitrophica bacterium]|nr:SPOR domain-containing protein [Candidatus Omnitrophota bacterium]
MKVYDNEDTGEQKDLFSELIQDASASPYDEPPKRNKLTLTLNVDKILLFVLTCAIIFAVVFSYGIETGKKIKIDDEGEFGADAEKGVAKKPSILSLFSRAEQAVKEKKTPAVAEDTTTVVVPITASEIPDPVTVEQAAQQTEVKQEVVLPIEKKAELPQEVWTVQIITYVNTTFAKEELRKTEEKGYEGFILPSGKYYQICVGMFATKAEAANLLDKFKKEKDYSDAYIRKVDRTKILT